MQSERAEYADKRRRGTSTRLVKLPGESGFKSVDEAPETIAKRLQVYAMEKRVGRK